MRGECLCGQVKFEILGSVPSLCQCHCSLCRKQSGSSSNSAMVVRADDFRWLSGAEHISSWVKDTGFRSDFCSRCGSPVPNPLRKSPYFWVPAGLLDAEVQTEIRAHLFVSSKAAWDPIAAPGVKYETMPEFPEFIELFHSKRQA